MKKAIYWTIFFIIIMVSIVWIQWPSSRVKFTMCDVGQGDGLVFSSGYSQMVVDVGQDNGGINNCLGHLMPFWDKNLEVVVVTHADSDHLGGLAKLFQRYKIGKVITTQAAHTKVSEILMNQGNISQSWQGQKWYFGKLSAEVMWPPYVPQSRDYGGASPQQVIESNSDLNATDNTNRQSLVVRMEVSDSQESVWLAGDADVWVENRLMAKNLVKPTSILKVGHHGSKTASSEPFLAILRPRQIWVSVGKNNRYGHPSKEVLELFERLGIPVLRTDVSGTISTYF